MSKWLVIPLAVVLVYVVLLGALLLAGAAGYVAPQDVELLARKLCESLSSSPILLPLAAME